MPNEAAEVARKLAGMFLRRGMYAFAGGAMGAAPQLAEVSPFAGISWEEAGFAGLSVQSVGYEEGVPDPKVHVYVTKGKKRAEKVIPTSVGNITVEINRVGKITVRPGSSAASTNQAHLFEHNQRISCGSSCAPSQENYAGTFGALVRKQHPASSLYMLSNNHVLGGCNHVKVGMPILSPSNADGQPGLRGPGQVARHSEIHELRSGEPLLVPPIEADVAIAEVTAPDSVTSWQGNDATGYDTPSNTTPLVTGMRVKKFGRTTGLTYGTVEMRVADWLPLPYQTRFFNATVWFDNVWSVVADPGDNFSLPGDSGSLVVTEDGSAAVGLVFAGNLAGDTTFIVPIANILPLFQGIALVTNYGV